MNRDEIIRMADEADLWADQELQCIGEYHPDWHEVRDMRFAALVAAAEREAIRDAISQIVVVPTLSHGILIRLLDVDDAIRARGQQ